MTDNGLYILAGLCLIVASSEWLVRRTALRHFGTALLVIVMTAVVANIGLLPAGSSAERPTAVYDAILAYVAPISIFWLLLQVNLRQVLQAGIPLIVLFLIGSLGTTFGVVLGFWWTGAAAKIGDLYAALGGMFVGTYTGGSVNFNAVGLHYDVVREGTLYGSSVVVDNVITTVWMIATLALPRILLRFWSTDASSAEAGELSLGIEEDTESVHPIDLGVVLALGLGALLLSETLAGWFAQQGFTVPSIILITIFALVIAQFPVAQRLRGAQVLGMFAVYLFLAVIGAFCDLASLASAGQLGLTIFLMASITVLFHGLFTYGAARLMKMDLAAASVASQANIGGGTSALALARSLGRKDLVLPAVLLGALGNALGTFLGFWAAAYLLPMLS